MRRLYLQITILIFLALASFGLGYYFIQASATGVRAGALLSGFTERIRYPTVEALSPKESSPIPLIPREVSSIWPDQGNGGFWYFEKGTGRLFYFNLATREEEVISDKVFQGFSDGTVNNNGQTAVIEQVLGENRIFWYLHLRDRDFIQLGPMVVDYSLEPNGNRLITLSGDDKFQTLISIDDPLTRQGIEIFKGRLKGTSLEWLPTGKVILNTYSFDGTPSVYLLDLKGHIQRIPFTGIQSNNFLASPDGSWLLVREPQTLGTQLLSLTSYQSSVIGIPPQSNCVWHRRFLMCLDHRSILTELNPADNSLLEKNVPLSEGMDFRKFFVMNSDLVGLDSLTNKIYLFGLP